jgi:hypothetical protein
MQTSTDHLQTESSFFAEDFKQHDRAIIDLNVRTFDFGWRVDCNGENEDIISFLELANYDITRLNSGRINDNTLRKVEKLGGGWHITPSYGLADRSEINYFRFKPENPAVRWSNGNGTGRTVYSGCI